MVEGLSATTIALLGFALLLFIVLVKTVYRFKRDLIEKTSEIEGKLGELEKETALTKKVLSEVRDDVRQKIDVAYLDKRIEGLIQLFENKSS